MNAATAGTLDFSRAQDRMRSYASTALLRLRAQAALNAVAVALFALAWVLVLLLFADKLFSLKSMGVNVWLVWAGVCALGVPYILWRTFAPSLHARRAAVLSDHRLNLHARLSSALTLDFSDPANAAFGEAFFDEALRKMSSVKVEEAFPIHMPRLFGWLAVPAALAALIYFRMPDQDVLGIKASAEKKRKAEALNQATAKKLEGKLEYLKKEIAEQGKDNSPIYKVTNLMEKADKIAKDLKDGEHDKEAVLNSMGSLKRDIQDEKERVKQGKEFLDRLEKLSAKDLNMEESDLTKQVSEALKMGDPGQAAKEMRKLAQKIKDDILNSTDKTDDQKRQELEKLQREVEKLAGALADDKELSKDLYQIAKTAKNDAEFEKFEAEIKKQLGKQGKKNLAEQLENDIENAADELERLEEDNDVKLDKDDEEEVAALDGLEKDVDDAIENMEEGKDGEKGDKADKGDAEGQGQKPGDKGQKTAGGKKAGSSKGQKSMKGKMGQKKGQGSQGEGKKGQGEKGGGGEGKENNNKDGKPGDGLGGGPGQGKRPYHDGENEFKSEKVKGELRAGAITGVSHFKGQGAKGDAPQEFIKALEAAEKESSSALDLERIPADARDMVKDYFTKVRDGANLPPAAQPAPEKK